jgi:hypothetical protein
MLRYFGFLNKTSTVEHPPWPSPNSLAYSSASWTRSMHATSRATILLYCTALQCTGLDCTALHCTALHCAVLCCAALDRTAPSYPILYYLLNELQLVFASTYEALEHLYVEHWRGPFKVVY